MNLAIEDQRLLEDLCGQQGVGAEKVLRLLEIVKDYEFKDRRAGVYEALREVLKSKTASKTTQARRLRLSRHGGLKVTNSTATASTG